MKTYKFKGIEYPSKGELEIAKFLTEMEIEFEHEFPIALYDYDKVKIWYPDFYLKEYQVVIEYFGMYNHNEAYRESAEHKKEVFKKCGIQFLPIYHLNKNWKEYTLKTIFSHLEQKTRMMNKNIKELEEKKQKGINNFIKKIFKKKKN